MSELILDEMSLEQLKAEADVLEVTYASNIGEDTLRKKLKEKLGLVDEGQTQPPAAPAQEQIKDPMMEPVTIIIAEDEKDKQPVFAALNGRSYVMKRGKEVTVPKAVVEILNNATVMKYDPETMEGRKVPRHSVRIIS